MVSNILALEASNVGLIVDLVLSLLFIGLIVVGDETKTTLVMRGFLNTQDRVESGISFMTLFQVLHQISDLGLELFVFLYKVSINKGTRGSRIFIIRATRQGEQFITRIENNMSR
jgi:hypothetical protein